VDAKPRILTATAHRGEPIVRKLLHSHAELVVVYTLAQAMRELAPAGKAGDGFNLVLATIHFDESRMFDLLRFARAAVPELPCVCTRVVDSVLAGSFLHAMVIAVESLGAVFVDRHELQRKHGEAEGDVLFRRIVLGHGRR
jgi:hypothetical protein